MSLFRAIAFILFVIAAVIAFVVAHANLTSVAGFIAAGLAALALDPISPGPRWGRTE